MATVVHPVAANPRLRIRRLITLLVEHQRATALEQLRQSLPLTDPDRHALDTDADRRFAALATNTTQGDSK